MAASRYWRLVGFRTRGGGDLELSALQLYDASGRADAAFPPSCTASPVTGSTSNLADADPATVARYAAKDAASPGFAFDWDFGPGGKDITYVRLGAGSVSDRFPASLLLLRSDDALSWVVSNKFEQYIYPGNGQLTLEPAPGVQVDPYLPDVTSLLRFNGVVGSNVITDETGRIWTSEGATLSMGASLDGTPSLLVGSTLGVSTPASADFNCGTGDITIEDWVFQTSRTGGGAVFGGIHYQNITGQNQIGTPVNSSFNLILASGVPLGAFFTPSVDVGIVAPAAVPLNTWVHLALVKYGNLVTLFVAGTPVVSAAFPTAVNSSTRKLAKGMDSTNSAVFQGFMGGGRITRGARYISAFTPDMTLGGGGLGILELVQRQCYPIFGAALPGVDAAAAAVWMPAHYGLVRDMEYSGRGCIAGTVKRKNTPVNTPLRRRVRLIHERSGLPIRETWSDDVTGNYRFDWIDESQTYTVISYDRLHDYRAVIADNLMLANGGVEPML